MADANARSKAKGVPMMRSWRHVPVNKLKVTVAFAPKAMAVLLMAVPCK